MFYEIFSLKTMTGRNFAAILLQIKAWVFIAEYNTFSFNAQGSP
jgi:hypothetical protein